MANELELENLLDARDIRVTLDLTAQTACLPNFGNTRSPPSHLAYFMLTTMRDLATADDVVLWEIYGDIISKWPESTTRGVLKSLEEQRQWVQAFQHQADPEKMAQTLFNIRKALATVNLEYIPPTSFPTFVAQFPEYEEELQQAIAVHHRSEQGKDSIYIPPFFLRVERLIQDSLISPGMGNLPGRDMDVAIVATAKAMVHESRHVVGTLLVQGTFSPPLQLGARTKKIPKNWVQGEAGDWYEVSRYGAIASPALVSPTSDGLLASTSLVLTGRINEEGDNLTLQYLLPSVVQPLANDVRKGKFILPTLFFTSDCTTNLQGFVLELNHFEPPMVTSTMVPNHPIPPTHTPSRHTTSARYSGPHILPRHTMKSVDSISDVRQLGFSNFRGVLRDPWHRVSN